MGIPQGRYPFPTPANEGHKGACRLSRSEIRCCMHIISRKTLRQFWEIYPGSKTALARWFKIMRHTTYHSFDDLHTTFPSADKVGKWIVFNIGGNKYRLIAVIHFNRGKVYVRHVLTHQEYDRGSWKQ